MKRTLIFVLSSVLSSVVSALDGNAQVEVQVHASTEQVTKTEIQINTEYQAHTGDSSFDSFLKNINIAAGNRMSVFITDLCTAYKLPEEEVKKFVQAEKIQPADALMILQLVKISGKPLNDVIVQFKQHRPKGWGAIALSLGIKPGSKSFVLLKEKIPQTIWVYEEKESQNSVEEPAIKGLKQKKAPKSRRDQKQKKVPKARKVQKNIRPLL